MKRIYKVFVVILLVFSLGLYISNVVTQEEVHAGLCDVDPEVSLPPDICPN